MPTCDVVVVGLGVVGAAAADRLARAGLRVTAFDRHAPPHRFGSSHGRTRIIREAYFEDPVYVPWVRAASNAWDELQAWRGRPLRARTGALNLAPTRSPSGRSPSLAERALRSAQEHGVECELLDEASLRARFPTLNPPPGFGAVYEPGAGVLFAEPCVSALLARASAAGASLRPGIEVLDIEPTDAGVAVATSDDVWLARWTVIAAGAWLPLLLPDTGRWLTIERQTSHWFGSREESGGAPGSQPVTLWEFADGVVLYTLPDLGDGVKAGLHHGGEILEPGTRADPVGEADWTALESRLHSTMPLLSARRDAITCMYVNTPDRHFLIDSHPADARVIIISACSGHGFKFAPAVAEATLALARSTGLADTGRGQGAQANDVNQASRARMQGRQPALDRTQFRWRWPAA